MNPEQELPLPGYARDLLHLQPLSAEQQVAQAKGFVRSCVVRNDAKAEMSHRDILFTGRAPPARRSARRPPRGLPGRSLIKRQSLRSLRHVTPELAAEANRLWLAYCTDCLPPVAMETSAAAIKQAAEAALRLDLTGARLRVVDAVTASQIGLEGVCLMETKLSFRLATQPRGRIVLIPKVGSAFQLDVGDTTRLTLFGSQLAVRPAERMTRKFRSGGGRPPRVHFDSLLEKAAADAAAGAPR